MYFGFIIVCVLFTTQSCCCQSRSKQAKIFCNIKNDTENNLTDIPSVLKSTLVIPQAIVKNRSLSVTVKVVDRPRGMVSFRACQLPQLGKTDKKCEPLVVTHQNKPYASHAITTRGQHLISLQLPDHLSCNTCILQLAYSKDKKYSLDGRSDVGLKSGPFPCGVFAVENRRAKRQAETCQGAGEYIDLPGIDDWCRVNCFVGYCPSTHCACANQAYPAEEDYGDEDDLRVEFLY